MFLLFYLRDFFLDDWLNAKIPTRNNARQDALPEILVNSSR
jgi:hypothetical protein